MGYFLWKMFKVKVNFLRIKCRLQIAAWNIYEGRKGKKKKERKGKGKGRRERKGREGREREGKKIGSKKEMY